MRHGGLIRSLITAVLCLALLSGCGKDGNPIDIPGTGQGKEFVVGEDVRKEDITEFYYTVSSTAYPPEFQRYRFYTEDGKYWFYHETREGEVTFLTEEHISYSGKKELSAGEWDAFFRCLEGGTVKEHKDNGETGGPFYYRFLYWNGDRDKYRELSFASYSQMDSFDVLCGIFTARSYTIVNKVSTDDTTKE